MAERLAPERAPEQSLSRPEPQRGGRRRWPAWLALGTAGVLVLGAITVLVGHLLLVDRSARGVRASALVPDGQPARVLVVLARPGQEVGLAGTLEALDRAGATVSVLSLTRGEAQAPLVGQSPGARGDLRAEELADAATQVGVDSVATGSLPDGGLLEADEAAVTAVISGAIAAFRPAILIAVDDLTGTDTDSQVVARYAVGAAQGPDAGVTRVWSLTRAPREADLAAALGAPRAASLPRADVAIDVGDSAVLKGSVLAAHGTQSPDLAARTYPYADRLPAWAYFRFLDREEFALAWGEPLP